MTETTEQQHEDHFDWSRGEARPVPDPTFLTTQQLNAHVAAVREILATRLNRMDKAVELLAAWRETVPEQIREEVAHLKDVTDEKLASLTTYTMTRFDGVLEALVERDKRRAQLASAKQIAAALQAQKESAGVQRDGDTVALVKMENNFIKLIDEGKAPLRQAVESADQKNNDLKSILDWGAC